MSLTITISGTYRDPEGKPLPDKTLTFESLYNSSQTQLKTTVNTVTDQAAGYSVALVPNFYSVCELDGKGRSKWLGNIQIFADSPPGTLNEYLTAFKTDQAQPGILAEMEEILEETKQVAADAGFTPRGPWVSTVNYEKNDLVQYAGSQYLATSQVSGIEPPSAPWELFLSMGETGLTGPANTLKIGNVETLPAGSPAGASIEGDAPDQTLNLSLPQGAPGACQSVDGVKPGDDGDVPLGAYTADNPPPLHIPAKGAPGGLVFATYGLASSHLYPGANVTGSSLMYAGINNGPTPILTDVGVGAGSYRCCGYIMVPEGATKSATLFVRTDTPQTVKSKLLKSGRIIVSNCRYSAPDESMIDCDMEINGQIFPLTVCATDVTEHIPLIFKNAKAGRYGPIAPYSE